MVCVLAICIAFTEDLFVLFVIRDVASGVSLLVPVMFFVVGGKGCICLDV